MLDHNEDILQKLASVYASAGGVGANLVMIVRGYASGDTEIYLGVCGEQSRVNGAYPKARVLYDSFTGNFPGCRDEHSKILSTEDTRVLMNRCFDPNYRAVAAVSCIASQRDEKQSQNQGFYQGLDKVIESITGHNYSIIMVASPLDMPELARIRSELESLSLSLSSYSKIQLGLNWSDAVSMSSALSKTLSDSLTNTNSVNFILYFTRLSRRSIYGCKFYFVYRRVIRQQSCIF